ncbi:MAG: hemolysin family protein [Pseudomonadota bacterium]
MSDDSSPGPDAGPANQGLFARLARAFSGPGETQLDAPALEGGAAEPPHELQRNAAAFDRLRVADVMVPRADIIAVDGETPLGQLAKLFAEASHSRLPIFRETLDDPVGMAHIKDVMSYLAGEPSGSEDSTLGDRQILDEIRRPVLYVPASMRAIDLLVKMQSRRMHMALVVDEFGGTDGLVTLEDLIEPIVGDIEDEHDSADAPAINAKGPAIWEADARAAIEDFENVVEREVATEDEEDDVDTLGGLVFMIAGRIPERGEVIVHQAGFEFEVLESDPRRIKRLRVRDTRSSSPESANGAAQS